MWESHVWSINSKCCSWILTTATTSVWAAVVHMKKHFFFKCRVILQFLPLFAISFPADPTIFTIFGAGSSFAIHHLIVLSSQEFSDASKFHLQWEIDSWYMRNASFWYAHSFYHVSNFTSTVHHLVNFLDVIADCRSFWPSWTVLEIHLLKISR